MEKYLQVSEDDVSKLRGQLGNICKKGVQAGKDWKKSVEHDIIIGIGSSERMNETNVPKK